MGSPLKYTSKPAGYSLLLFNASIKASSSTISPRATFVITAPVGKYSTVSLLIKFSVSFVAGQQIDNTSETKKNFLNYRDIWHHLLFHH